MGRHSNEGLRLTTMTAAALALVASAPTSTVETQRAQNSTAISAMNQLPRPPQAPNSPATQTSRGQQFLGERVRKNMQFLGVDQNTSFESGNHDGKFSNDEGFQYSARDIATNNRKNHSRSPRGKATVYDAETREEKFSQSNDLAVLVRQELTHPSEHEPRLNRQIQAAVKAVLDPWHVTKGKRAEIDLQDQVTAILNHAALNNSDPLETAAKIEAAKMDFEKKLKPEKKVIPEPKENLGWITLKDAKPRPFTQQEQLAFVNYLLKVLKEGENLKVTDDGEIESAKWLNFDRLCLALNISREETMKFDFDAIDKFFDFGAIHKFISANLDIFLDKSGKKERRIQKLIHVQLAQALKNHAKTRSVQRREGHRASLIVDPELLELEDLEGHPVVENDHIIFADTSEGIEAAADTQEYVFDQSQDYHGYDPKEEEAKAKAYLASLQTSDREAWGATSVFEFDDTDVYPDIVPKTGRRAAKAALSRLNRTHYEEA